VRHRLEIKFGPEQPTQKPNLKHFKSSGNSSSISSAPSNHSKIASLIAKGKPLGFSATQNFGEHKEKAEVLEHKEAVE
jgi:hypothetical protein